MKKHILIINPGSTSTKIAVFQEEVCLFEAKITHTSEEILVYPTVLSQYQFRKKVILEELEKRNFDLGLLDAVCGRGGMLQPMKSGTYIVNDEMLADLKAARRGEHASNLGALLADEIAKPLNIPAFIVDPVAVDEMEDIARISGMKEIERQCIFHALNHKAIGRKVAKDHQKTYEQMNLIIVHLGGGISVAAHQKGQVIDVNNALDGDGPMSPERSGTVPLGPLYKMCFSGKYSLADIKRMNVGQGGLVSYLGTNDARLIKERIQQGDRYAKLIYDAMIYQIAKEIGSCATVLKGKLDYTVLTGGLAYDTYLTEELKDRVSFLAPVLSYPGEDEMLSLA
ncbi:MAG: butyrate kinase [Bacilli bacterium]|nr:butyrate kinase [Bacilli bacterium]